MQGVVTAPRRIPPDNWYKLNFRIKFLHDSSLMKTEADKPTVAHVCVPYLRATETFIYDRIAFPQKFRSIVATNEPVVHRDLFPHPAVRTMADRPTPVRKANAGWQRWFGYSPWYLGALRREGAGVIHAHYGPVGCSVLRVKEKLALPLVTSFYGQDASALLRDPRYARKYETLFERCEMISVLSGDMKRRMADASCPADRIAIHHLAVDTDEVPPRRDEPEGGEVKILFAGRFVEKKGVAHLLEAFRRAVTRGAEARLLLAGDGPLHDDLAKKTMELKLQGKVEFLGMRRRGEVLKLMRESHIFALHSVTAADGDREGTPTVLIEAGAVGVPSVSTLHAGIPEIVEDGATGLLTAERDEEAFGELLYELCTDPDRRKAMGEKARKKIEREFSLKAVVKQLEKDYSSLMK